EPGGVGDKRYSFPDTVKLSIFRGVDAGHDITVAADGFINHVGHIFQQVEQVHLGVADVGLIGEVRRVASSHGGLHLPQEVAKGFGVGGGDIEVSPVGSRKILNDFTEDVLGFLKILGAMNDGKGTGST